jgi:hypothetical protein
MPVTISRPPETSPSHKTPSSVLLTWTVYEDCIKVEDLRLRDIDRQVFCVAENGLARREIEQPRIFIAGSHRTIGDKKHVAKS